MQKPIPNHQSSVCWIYLPLLTLSLIWSSCPPFHHWTSLGFHFTGLNHIPLVGLSGWPGEGEVSEAHQLVTGVPLGSVLGPLLFSTYTTSLGPITPAHGFSYHCCTDDTALSLFNQTIQRYSARISGCLADISAWMKEHHLQLNLAKNELIFFPATPTLQHDFTIKLGSSIITSSTSVRNLVVSFDDQLTFKEHIAKTARSCRFALYNIRKIRPFLIEYAAQLLVQALVISRMDYCNALLVGLQSNLYKWFRMQQHDWSSTNPKEAMLHLSLPSSTGYQLQLASSSRHWFLHIEQPQAQHPPTSTHYYEFTSPPEVWDLLVSDASWYHHREAKITLQNILVHHSWLVELSSHPHPECWIPVNLQAITENSSLSTLHDSILNFIFFFSFSFSLSPLGSLYLFEQCLRLGVRGTSSVWLPLQD